MLTSLLVLTLLQSGAAASKAATPARMIRAEVGPSGVSKGGTFVLDEQREAFDVAKDKQVIVSFEWEAAPAVHKCELSWVAPDGTVALQTMLDLDAKGRRFSGYWSLLLNPTMARGLWAAEVKVDGVAAGSRTFRVTGPPIVKDLPADELYKLASDTTLRLEAILPAGSERRFFRGFAIGDESVITTFGAINAASAIDVLFPGGEHVQTSEVWSFSRDLDWVMLKVKVPPTAPRLKVAESAKVGDRCAFLNVNEGQREITPCSVVGRNTTSPVARWSITHRPSPIAVGGPLLNGVGEVVGLVGASSRPGGGVFDDGGGFGSGFRPSSAALLVMPVHGLRPMEGAAPDNLSAFWERGLFYKPVTANSQVSYGTLAVGAADPRGVGARNTGGTDFSTQEGILTALITWQPRAKIDSTLNHICYDMANRPVFTGKATKVSFRQGLRVDSSSQIDISTFPSGEYRLDILLGDEVAWRTYFRVK